MNAKEEVLALLEEHGKFVRYTKSCALWTVGSEKVSHPLKSGHPNNWKAALRSVRRAIKCREETEDMAKRGMASKAKGTTIRKGPGDGAPVGLAKLGVQIKREVVIEETAEVGAAQLFALLGLDPEECELLDMNGDTIQGVRIAQTREE